MPAYCPSIKSLTAKILPLDRLGTKFWLRKLGGGGSRTPVRKALRLEAYMLIAFDLFRQPRLERARRAAG
jgi:hypothetical protein